MLSPVHVRAGAREEVHLTGVSQEASVTVRVFSTSHVSVSGETLGGERFSKARTYRRCGVRPPAPPQEAPRRGHPGPRGGGGEKGEAAAGPSRGGGRGGRGGRP